MDSAAISTLMRSNWATIFGSYHYSLLKSFSEMAKSAMGAEDTKGRARDTARAWDRIAMVGLVMLGLYPLLDELAKKATHDPHARVKRFGPFGFIDAMGQAAQGKQSPSQVAERVVTPAPQTKAAAELLFNRQFFSGQQIYDYHAAWKSEVAEIGRYLLGQLGQLGQASHAQETSEGARRYKLEQVGIQIAKTKAEKVAQDIATGKVGSEVEDADDRKNRVERREILDQLRKGNRKPLEDARSKGDITAKQEHTLEERARRTPLEDTVHGFSYAEVWKVYQAAKSEKNQDEMKQLEPILRKKRGRMWAEHRGAEVEKAESE